MSNESLIGRSNYDLRYILRFCSDADLRNRAGEQLKGQEPSNEDLCEIIEKTDLVDEAAEMLRERLGAKMVDEGALVKDVAKAVLARPSDFDMGHWHCGTTHCWAGWGCLISPIAKEIEKEHGTRVAGCATMPHYAKNFYLSNDEALGILREIAAQ
ncbi:hypothetical protein [Chitinophaga japonensis]|uniref:Uncharacterized protein n=1 Tax=Chitinophaga japonensis TaxID=104662 RepID=A0A562SYE4_CHIJA|nr:hypothetical protein [Chitinophaga japonensis]TWI86331.1 hypothetical protein LX66_3585 [Chitinophaga japonensis]